MKRKNINDIVFVEHRSENGNKINIPIDFLIDGYDKLDETNEQLNEEISIIEGQMKLLNSEYKKRNGIDISTELVNIFNKYRIKNNFDLDKKLHICLEQIIDNNNLLENFFSFINKEFKGDKGAKLNKEALFRYSILIKVYNEKLLLRREIIDYNLMKINEIKEEEKTKSSR